jgi:hypothetical protein
MPMTLRRLWIQVTSDRRRFGMLCACVIAGLLLWARLIVVSNMPRTAVADENPGANSVTAKSVDSKGAAENKPRPVVQVELARTVNHDPFVISAKHYPKPLVVVDLGKEASKSQPQPVEDSEQREARLVAQLRSLVDRLKLEAAMVGGEMAVISDRTYRRGDWIKAGDDGEIQFKLTEVRQRSVILEHDDRRFELKMATPGG